MCGDSGAILYTVECAFGGRPFEVTTADNPFHIQVRTDHELWLKENLINIGILRLPANAKYIATVDGDFTFLRPDWAQETIQQLQHHAVVQMFSTISYLGPTNDHLTTGLGFVESWLRGNPIRTHQGLVKSNVFWHTKKAKASLPREYPHQGMTGEASGQVVWGVPGGAWAYRREALDGVGGLIDFNILGAADYFMTAGLFGEMEGVLPIGYSPQFKSLLLDWQDRARIPAWRSAILPRSLSVLPKRDRVQVPGEKRGSRRLWNPLVARERGRGQN